MRRCRRNARISAASSTWCSSAVNRVWRDRRAATWTRSSPAGRDARPCVRSLASSLGSSSGRGLPSGMLVAFAAIIGTTPRSATLLPLHGSGHPSPSTPAGNHPAAKAGLPGFQRNPYLRDVALRPRQSGYASHLTAQHVLPSTAVTVSASAISRLRGSIPHPTGSLCTLRPRRYRSHPQHSLPGGSLRLTRAGLSPRRIALTLPSARRLRRNPRPDQCIICAPQVMRVL